MLIHVKQYLLRNNNYIRRTESGSATKSLFFAEVVQTRQHHTRSNKREGDEYVQFRRGKERGHDWDAQYTGIRIVFPVTHKRRPIYTSAAIVIMIII